LEKAEGVKGRPDIWKEPKNEQSQHEGGRLEEVWFNVLKVDRPSPGDTTILVKNKKKKKLNRKENTRGVAAGIQSDPELLGGAGRQDLFRETLSAAISQSGGGGRAVE